MKQPVITIKGARVHNLKNINVTLPRYKLVVLTGLSGSGKSSLAFDTIYAEGQRRYVESLSAYARQFLGLQDKPDVDQIDGLSPTIAINQKAISHNPRSTVGTITEIYDYLRLLFARIGHPHCPKCKKEIQRQSIDQIVEKLQALPRNTTAVLLAPIVRSQKGEHKHMLAEVRQAGYTKVRFDGVVMSVDEAEDLTVDKQKKHTVEVVVDRLVLGGAGERSRLAESVEAALDLGNGILTVLATNASNKTDELLFSQHFACPHCDINLPEIEPRSFSFNSPYGACPECSGLGTKLEVDPLLVIPNHNLTIAQGAIRPWSRTSANQAWYQRVLEQVGKKHDFSIHQPIKELSEKQIQIILNGTPGENYDLNWGRGDTEFSATFEGVIPNLQRKYKETESDYMRSEIERYMRIHVCPKCDGQRLKEEVLGVLVNDKSIAEVSDMTVEQSGAFFVGLKLSAREQKIAKQVLKEINDRLSFLHNVGLDYLTLNRGAASLSGGEAQRIRLATQIGSALTGVIYVLDEPTIGLHQKDNERLIATLKHLRDLGNTVLVVEHDADTMLAADEIVDIGPGAGKHGGEIVAQGTPAQLMKNPKSLTGKYLSGVLNIPLPKQYRKGNGKKIVVKGASEHNLKNVDVEIPLAKFVCLTGVSGSGKSTLMIDILAKALAQKLYHAKDLPGAHKSLTGIEHIDKVIHIDQSPIGRTPRSNPATYTGVFTAIRDLYTEIPEAKIRGYKAGRFSFNVKGGRCEGCSGDGLVRIEMQFLPDVYVECEECHGARYNKEALEIHYHARNISEVLNMTVEEATTFFEKIPAIQEKLKTLFEVGLGYMTLGQSATTLSGGEAQRIKLATELSRRATGKTLYLLDEPTTGLHFEDIKRLLGVLQRLVDKSNTVLIIEHNLDVIKSADWVIDLGQGGGDKGGELVAQGTPKDVAKSKRSFTGQYLKRVL